ncbi:hypothetical protein UA08_00514 [Talaromyces atroroseus]|uniref:Major facilitator superfamily (MFS) profile domain-containing protein n=1 Tax=Talaromyces atroroseus TaxID=1441469 RepID=A0A225B3B1_TALAT|nr:hypothetical protein UA08_00514 [Talaromyces atroroseus]OKL64208.1 hypothetical protein UA08_00514 [Talaromyces atroroseus]
MAPKHPDVGIVSADDGVDIETASCKVVSEATLSPAETRRLVRRIDLCILPILFVSYMLQYLDKSAMSNTAILGLRTDLHLSGSQYSWASSIFNFGYLAASAPFALLMVRFPIGKFMAVSVSLWAVVLCCTGATQNATSLMATRFFLGFMEAAVAPGFSIITSTWYTRSEQPIRHGVWFLGNVVSGLFGSPLMYAFGHVNNYPAWRIVFFVFGGITLLWGIALIFILPDSPSKARFLTDTARVQAAERVQKDTLRGNEDNKWDMKQMWEALRDPKAWFTVIIMLCANIPNGGIGNFAAIVIEGFGFTRNETYLVNMIVTAFQGGFIVVFTLASSYLKNMRTISMAISTVIALVGAVMIRQIHSSNLWARYFGYCLLSAYTSNFPLMLSMNASNIAGKTKKTTINAMTFIAYCAGNIIGPQLFFADQAPSYPSGFASMLVCFAVGIVAILFLRFYLIWENKRRDAREGPLDVDGGDAENEQTLDLTDQQIRGYRYLY